MKFYSDINCDFIQNINQMQNNVENCADEQENLITHNTAGLQNVKWLDTSRLTNKDIEKRGLYFVEECLKLIKNLKVVENKPRVVKRTIYRLINHLRVEVMFGFYGLVHERFSDVFNAYNELICFLSECIDDNTTQYTTLTIEELISLDSYTSEVQRICAGVKMYKISETWLLYDLKN